MPRFSQLLFLSLASLLTLLVFTLPAEAHRLNWLTVRAYALNQAQLDAETTMSSYPNLVVTSGIASRCWRQGDHRVGCPIYLEAVHIDAGTQITTRFLSTVLAQAP